MRKVWVAFLRNGTTGQYFLWNDQSNAVTVAKECFIPVLEQFCGDLDERECFKMNEKCFQLEVGHSLTASVTMASVNKMFRVRHFSTTILKWKEHLTPLSEPSSLFVFSWCSSKTKSTSSILTPLLHFRLTSQWIFKRLSWRNLYALSTTLQIEIS